MHPRPAAPDAPRAVVIGSLRDPLRPDGGALLHELSGQAHLLHIDASSVVRDGLRALLRASAAIAHSGFETVHVLDARFAPVGAALGRRHHVPVSVTVAPHDVRGRGPWSGIALRALRRSDEAFTWDAGVAQALRADAWRLPVSIVQPAAHELPWPRKRDVTRVARALRGVRPGRLVLGVPWPHDPDDFRWFRDVVQPALRARPVCLLFGVRGRRRAKIMLLAAGVQHDYRLLTGGVDASLIAAIARAVDAFALPAPLHESHADDTALSLALAVSGAPVVSDGRVPAPVFAHERNALLSEPGGDRGFAETLDQLLGLPAVQRHFLGDEFARFTLRRWPWAAVAAVYADRFAALVGRPRIPAGLRAA